MINETISNLAAWKYNPRIDAINKYGFTRNQMWHETKIYLRHNPQKQPQSISDTYRT